MARYRIVPERSRLWAEARSSLHAIHVDTTGFEGEVTVEDGAGGPTLHLPTRLEIDAGRLKSGNGLIDHELERRLDTRKFPRVRGTVKESRSVGVGGLHRLVGDLSLHGVTRSIEGEVHLRTVDGETIEVEGEKTIDMRDFGLDPPRLLMLRVHPEVKVRALVVATREA